MEYKPVGLAGLLAGDQSALDTLHDELKAQGWCILVLPEGFQSQVSGLMKGSKEFFDKNLTYKKTFAHPPRYGYVSTDYKEALRLLTGSLSEGMTLPKEVQHKATDSAPHDNDGDLLTICKTLDEIAKTIIYLTSKKIFGVEPGELGEKKLVPLLLPRNTLRSSPVGYGMLDIVHYLPGKRTQDGDVVAPHGDPGLFSLSLLSTAPGLELLHTPSGNWIPVPLDAGVLWCGATATEVTSGLIPAGWHRVLPTYEVRATPPPSNNNTKELKTNPHKREAG